MARIPAAKVQARTLLEYEEMLFNAGVNKGDGMLGFLLRPLQGFSSGESHLKMHILDKMVQGGCRSLVFRLEIELNDFVEKKLGPALETSLHRKLMLLQRSGFTMQSHFNANVEAAARLIGAAKKWRDHVKFMQLRNTDGILWQADPKVQTCIKTVQLQHQVINRMYYTGLRFLETIWYAASRHFQKLGSNMCIKLNSKLCRLPAEIRIRIYQELYISSDIVNISTSFELPGKPGYVPALPDYASCFLSRTFVGKDVAAEGLRTFYSHNTFGIFCDYLSPCGIGVREALNIISSDYYDTGETDFEPKNLIKKVHIWNKSKDWATGGRLLAGWVSSHEEFESTTRFPSSTLMDKSGSCYPELTKRCYNAFSEHSVVRNEFRLLLGLEALEHITISLSTSATDARQNHRYSGNIMDLRIIAPVLFELAARGIQIQLQHSWATSGMFETSEPDHVHPDTILYVTEWFGPAQDGDDDAFIAAFGDPEDQALEGMPHWYNVVEHTPMDFLPAAMRGYLRSHLEVVQGKSLGVHIEDDKDLRPDYIGWPTEGRPFPWTTNLLGREAGYHCSEPDRSDLLDRGDQNWKSADQSSDGSDDESQVWETSCDEKEIMTGSQEACLHLRSKAFKERGLFWSRGNEYADSKTLSHQDKDNMSGSVAGAKIPDSGSTSHTDTWTQRREMKREWRSEHLLNLDLAKYMDIYEEFDREVATLRIKAMYGSGKEED